MKKFSKLRIFFIMCPFAFLLAPLLLLFPLGAYYRKPEEKVRVGVACIVQKEGKVLLGKRKGSHGIGSFAPPGGHLEFGESVEECAKRELLEETGLEALSFRLGPWVENIIEKKHYITLFVFIDNFTGDPSLLEPEKCEEWCWFTWDNLPTPLFPSMTALLEKLEIPNSYITN